MPGGGEPQEPQPRSGSVESRTSAPERREDPGVDEGTPGDDRKRDGGDAVPAQRTTAAQGTAPPRDGNERVTNWRTTP